MSTITLTPKLQIANPPAEKIHRRSLAGVLWGKFLGWVEKASAESLWKATRRTAIVVLILFLSMAPSFTIGYLTAAAKWNGYRLPIFFGLLTLILNAKRIYRFVRRRSFSIKRGNQNTFLGFSVTELADLLTETQAFKREDTSKRLAMSQTQYQKIGNELEKYGVLVRGESNARILRPISREELVKQLRENFPLAWDETRQAWFERDGQFERWTLNNEWKQRRISEDTEKRERKLERIEKKIVDASAFQNILSMAA